MADIDEQFNETIDTLRQRFFRTSLVALVLLYFVLAGLDSAMLRVQSDEVAKVLARVEQLDLRELNASWVFSAQTQFLTPRDGDTPKEVVTEVGRELERMAREWFSVQFEIVGTKISIDLRTLAPAIPFLAIVAFGYFVVLYQKIRVVEAALHATASTEPVKPPWRREGFHRHPNILVQWAIFLAALMLLGNTVETINAMAPLVSRDLRFDYLDALIAVTTWTAFYINFATAALRAERVRSSTPLGFARRILSRVQPVTTAAVEYRSRLQFAAGTVLLFATLVMTTGVACGPDFNFDPQYERQLTGYKLLTDDDVLWFSSTVPYFSWGPVAAYAGVLGTSVFGLLILLLRHRKRGRVIRWFVRFARLSCATMLTLGIGTICFFCRSENFRELGNIYGQLVPAAAVLWLWRARYKPESYDRRRELLGLVLLPMAFTFGLQGVAFLWDRNLIGVPTLLVGTLMQYRIYSAFLARQGSGTT